MLYSLIKLYHFFETYTTQSVNLYYEYIIFHVEFLKTKFPSFIITWKCISRWKNVCNVLFFIKIKTYSNRTTKHFSCVSKDDTNCIFHMIINFMRAIFLSKHTTTTHTAYKWPQNNTNYTCESWPLFLHWSDFWNFDQIT